MALFMLLGFLLPTQLGKHFFFPFSYISGVRVDYLAPTIYLIDLIVLAILFVYRAVWLRHLRTHLACVLLTALALNVAFSQIPWLSFYWGIRTLAAIALFLVIVRIRKGMMRPFVVGLVVQSCIQLGLVVTQLISRHSLGGIWWALGERPLATTLPDIAKMTILGVEYLRPYGTFSHPNSMGGFYALIAVWTLCLGLHKKLTKALFGLSVALVALSFSKGAIIGLGAGIAVWSIVSVTKKQKYPWHVGIVGAVLIMTTGLLWQFVASDILATSKRIALLEQAANLFATNSLFGVGRGAYVAAQSSYDFGYSYFFAQPVHNIFALILVELGIVGMGAMMYLAWRSRVYKNKALWPLFAVVVATGLVDHYWLTLIQNWYILPIICAFAIPDSSKNPSLINAAGKLPSHVTAAKY